MVGNFRLKHYGVLKPLIWSYDRSEGFVAELFADQDGLSHAFNRPTQEHHKNVYVTFAQIVLIDGASKKLLLTTDRRQLPKFYPFSIV